MTRRSLNHEDPTIFDHLVTILKLECQTAGPPLGDGGAGGGEWRAGGGDPLLSGFWLKIVRKLGFTQTFLLNTKCKVGSGLSVVKFSSKLAAPFRSSMGTPVILDTTTTTTPH